VGVTLTAAYLLSRRPKKALVVAAIVTFAVAGSVFYRWSVTGVASVAAVWDFFYVVTPGLPSARHMISEGGVVALAVDRAKGVLVAFNPANPYSYFSSFGAAVYLLPLAVLFGWEGGQWRDPLRRASAATGFLMLAPVHAVHAQHYGEWLFNTRHGLYLIFLLVPATCVLLVSERRLLKGAALLIVSVTALSGAGRILALGRSEWPRPPQAEVRAFARWLASWPETPTVISTDPQMLSTISRARFHWIGCYEPGEATRVVAERLPIDLIVVLPQDRECACWEDLHTWTSSVWTSGDVHVVRPLRSRVTTSPHPSPLINASAGTAGSR
jgi:hypothetical protein